MRKKKLLSAIQSLERQVAALQRELERVQQENLDLAYRLVEEKTITENLCYFVGTE